ncbi:protein Shroom3-like isoform X2 [Dendronephthya gigantea]|nr:protein Shroom3-like isoform X2 [Dendronephthya gigantea]XP_028397538.1 protein Shroom3-like isoform X2 [Dendronephthya gigantea]
MNIRLADNYFAKALESPLQKEVYTHHNTEMVSNNKRSSKEYEKDLSYSFGSNTVNAVIDYPSGQSRNSQINVTRLTRSTADLSEYTQPKDMFFKDNVSSSPPWKNQNNPPGSPDKVQRVRIVSTNLSPGHYKYSSENDNSSPSASFDDGPRHSDGSRSSTPSGYNTSAHKSFNSSAMEDLNRTWPSVAISDVSSKDSHLVSPGSAFSVSAAKSHFEQMSKTRSDEQRQVIDRPYSSSSSLAPKPPSRTSSFRSRLSSSSSVFTDSPEKTQTSNGARQNSFSYGSSTQNTVHTPTRKASSADDLDKPQPPKRYSQSSVLSSFRSNKKPGHIAKASTPSHVYDQGENDLYHHARTQSEPSSKIIATRLSSKSWVKNEGEDSNHEERNERLPRSSSFSRAHVIETSSVQTVRPETRLSRRSDDATVKTVVQRDDTKAPVYPAKPDVMSRSPGQTGVIQALRTGEIASDCGDTRMKTSPKQDGQNNDRWNKQGDGKKDQYMAEHPKPDTYSSKAEVHSKSDIYKPKPIVQPKSILKRETSKHETKRDEPKESPLLKENSLMQRLLQESQGQGGSSERSTAAAIEEEINQRTGKASITVKSSFEVPKTATVEQHRRSEIASNDQKLKQNTKLEELRQESKESKMNSKPLNQEYEISQNMIQHSTTNDSKSNVEHDLDVKTRISQPIKDQSSSPNLMDSVDDSVFVEHTVEQGSMVAGQPIESNIDDIDDIKNEESDVVTPFSELIVKAEIQEAVLESYPSHLSDNSDIIAENNNLETTEIQACQKVKKRVETKYADTLSPTDIPLKSIHSRENSASSLLEETLESAKIIASIYSVEGPTRSPDGEDSFYTASEMRRQSLAKRAVRSRPKLDLSTFTPPRGPDQSLTKSVPAVQNEGDDDSAGNRSTGSLSSSGSRPDSGILSPKLEALEEQKEILISSMKKKVELLQEQESEIQEEMKQNDNLGKQVAEEVKSSTSGTEYSKFELFVGELNNIIGLLLSLTQRMHRYEILLQDIDLADENGRDKRDVLLQRIDGVKEQYEEACRLKEVNDKRGETVSKIVEDYCSDEKFADFQHFVDMKTQLALTRAEIRDKIKLGEEKLNALTSAHIDWSTLDLSMK